MRVTKLLRSATDKAAFGRNRTGAPPGTLIYTGRQEMEDVYVHLTYYDAGRFYSEVLVNELPPDRDRAGCVTWFDVRGLHDTTMIERLGREHAIHPLAQEDIVDVYQRPKIEIYSDGILMIIKAFAFDKATRQISVEQVSLWLTDRMVITFQEDAGDLFGSVRKRLENGHGRIRGRGADYLAYALIDNVVDRYFAVLDQMEETLDELEDIILRDPRVETKSHIHDLRLALLTMRKSTSPTRELAGRLADTDHRLVSEDTQLYVRDLKDHIIQITDLVETYRDVNNGLYDLYVSEISFRTNAVMQTLTVVSTVFIPLGFLAGVYGMNFAVMPGTQPAYAFWVFCGAMVVIALAILLWFHSRRWI